jgi:hypothetical protein
VDYFLGLDLGQASDYSALAILERTEKMTDIVYPDKPPRKEASWHFGCRFLKRWPLGTAYTTVVAEIGELVRKPPLAKATLVVDATGVGRPVVDMFRKAQLPVTLVPVMITSGTKESNQDGYHHVPKMILVSTLQVLFQQRRLKILRALPETAALVRELQNYRVKITESANEVFEGREGEHDDLIVATALAAWRGERSGKTGPFRFQMLGVPNIRFVR